MGRAASGCVTRADFAIGRNADARLRLLCGVTTWKGFINGTPRHVEHFGDGSGYESGGDGRWARVGIKLRDFQAHCYLRNPANQRAARRAWRHLFGCAGERWKSLRAARRCGCIQACRLAEEMASPAAAAAGGGGCTGRATAASSQNDNGVNGGAVGRRCQRASRDLKNKWPRWRQQPFRRATSRAFGALRSLHHLRRHGAWRERASWRARCISSFLAFRLMTRREIFDAVKAA